MTIAEYQEAGYAVSNHVRQEQVDKIEANVRDAYIKPIQGTASGDYVTAAVKAATMELTFFGLLRSEIQATRIGAKVKTVTNSYTPDLWQVMNECAKLCDLKLMMLREACANDDASVYDYLGIYFKSNFVSL